VPSLGAGFTHLQSLVPAFERACDPIQLALVLELEKALIGIRPDTQVLVQHFDALSKTTSSFLHCVIR